MSDKFKPWDVIQGLPKHPVVLRGGSRYAPEGYKIPGKVMKFTRNVGLLAVEQMIKNLNTFIGQFIIRGGTHRRYIRVFNCGDHRASTGTLVAVSTAKVQTTAGEDW
jgi:hypothetical protein